MRAAVDGGAMDKDKVLGDLGVRLGADRSSGINQYRIDIPVMRGDESDIRVQDEIRDCSDSTCHDQRCIRRRSHRHSVERHRSWNSNSVRATGKHD